LLNEHLVGLEVGRLLNQPSLETKYVLPAETGSGYCRQIRPDKTLQVVQCEAYFHQPLQIPLTLQRQVFQISFCFEGPLTWQTTGGASESVLNHNESYLCYGENMSGINYYARETQYSGIVINMQYDRFHSILKALKPDWRIYQYGEPVSAVRRMPVTATVRRLLGDIIGSSCDDSLKRLYLEAKVLELIAVYMNEMVEEKQVGCGAVQISARDIEGLREIKRILDQSIDAAPTIKTLARMTCLNEFKIKTGFKQMFGMPVHAYVVDKRMEAARDLLEGKKIKVGEVASLVGYTNTSHFIAAFRKRFDMTPGEYCNSDKR